MATTRLEKRKTYDPILRLSHWWNALTVAGLLGTGWGSEWFEHGAYEAALWRVHIFLGYGLIIGLAVRLAWGLAGPQHARFSDMWHPRIWWQSLRTFRFPPTRRFGHHELASLAYLGVYGLIAVMAITGLALAAIEQDTGPFLAWLPDSLWNEDLFGEPHEFVANVLAAFVGVHLAALYLHQKLEGIPMAGSMLTGDQYRTASTQGETHA